MTLINNRSVWFNHVHAYVLVQFIRVHNSCKLSVLRKSLHRLACPENTKYRCWGSIIGPIVRGENKFLLGSILSRASTRASSVAGTWSCIVSYTRIPLAINSGNSGTVKSYVTSSLGISVTSIISSQVKGKLR